MEVHNAARNSPQSCLKTMTLRRNPRRRARDTPLTNIPVSFPKPTPARSSNIPSFPIQDILSIDVKENQKVDSVSTEERHPENLKVYLRIRPGVLQSNAGRKSKAGAENLQAKNAWPKNPRAKSISDKKLKRSSKVCLVANDLHSVTLVPPEKLQDGKRTKSEVYEGFSNVFSPEASQKEVYEEMVNPLIVDILRGKSGMLVALGPSGSGKTHTIFGSGKDPGMVTLALRQLFSEEDDRKTESSRIFHLSMFEICSEKGKSEKIFDLSQDGADLCTQYTSIKSLQETRVYDIHQAESIIGSGLLKRATAMTNSNSQSSRSQCIINIRCGHKKGDGESGETANSSILTIVDLAGAEREKKTGNQGARLLESNFINNTSMVFGQCLRSLLEHQKNPKKPLHKHFQNSMLTRYLRDYLEGKKRMALLLTARPEEEDYIDTSFLLRQASPYTKIKFDCVEEPVNLNCNKRPLQTMFMSEQLKRMKIGDIEDCKPEEVKIEKGPSVLKEELTPGGVDDSKSTDVSIQSEEDFNSSNVKEKISPIACRTNIEGNDRQYQSEEVQIEKGSSVLKEAGGVDDSKSTDVSIQPEEDFNSANVKENISPIACRTNIEGNDRQYQVLLGFSKALWNVLKDYKKKLEVAENEIYCLREELKDVKNLQSSKIVATAMAVSTEDCQSTEVGEVQKITSEVNPELSSCQLTSSEQTGNTEFYNHNQFKKSSEGLAGIEDMKLQDVDAEDTYSNGKALADILTDSCVCTDQDDGISEERTDSPLMKSTTKSCQLPTHEKCQLQNEEIGESPEDAKLEVENTLGCEAPMTTVNSCQCTDQEYENPKERTDAILAAELTANSHKSPNSSYQPRHDEGKKHVHTPTPNPEDVRTCNPRCDDSNTLEVVPKLTSCDFPRNVEKPKRRLQPASSILLKSIGTVHFVDENEKVKGTKGEKKASTAAINVKNRSDGSLSLLRLLTNQTR